MTQEINEAIDADCPECGESAMYETVCTVDDRDNVRCAMCDACGYTIYEDSPAVEIPK